MRRPPFCFLGQIWNSCVFYLQTWAEVEHIYSGLSLTWPFSQAGQTTKCWILRWRALTRQNVMSNFTARNRNVRRAAIWPKSVLIRTCRQTTAYRDHPFADTFLVGGKFFQCSYQPRSQDCKNRGHSMFLGGGGAAETFSNRSLYYSNLIIAHIQAKTTNWGAVSTVSWICQLAVGYP